MAKIKRFPKYLKNESEIAISLFKDEVDSNLIGKEFFIQFSKIDEYELFEKNYTLNSSIEKKDENIFVKLKIMLPKGFYVISGYSNRIENDIYCNSIFLPEDMNAIQIYEELSEVNLDKIEKIKTYAVINYIEKKKKGLGLMKQNNISYKGYSFIINAYIGKIIDLGTAKLFPIHRLDNFFIKEYMSSVLKSQGASNGIELPSRVESFDDPNSQPGILLEVENIYAKDINEASEILMKYTENMVKVLAISNNSHGEIIGDVIVDKLNNKMYHRSMIFPYLGNLFVGMEDPKSIKELNDNISNDLSNYYVALYLDAMKERSIDIRRLKLWTILESISKNKNYAKSQEILFNGEEVLDKKNIPVLIGDRALQNVRELLRRYFNKKEMANTIDENQLKIWYQERNCTAHKGRCLFEDYGFCNSQKETSICRAYESSIRIENKRDVDTGNSILKNLVRDVIKYEISVGL